MTVKELKQKLEMFDDDYEVIIDLDTCDNELSDIIPISEVYEGSCWNVVIK